MSQPHHSKKKPNLTPKMTSENLESALTNMGYFLHHLDPDIRENKKKKTLTCSLKDFEKKAICRL